MATLIEQAAKREQPEQTQAPAGDAAADAIAKASASSATTIAIDKAKNGALPGVDTRDFVSGDRIHVKHGSLFIDPYLVLHPHELAPENEAKLREKLHLTYSVNNPSFYESYDRVAIALNLGQLVPVSLESKHSKLMELIKNYNAQVDSGSDAELHKLSADKRAPFAAIVRETLQHPAKDPVGIETLKNGLAVYLLVREKLTSQGFLSKLTDYVVRNNTSDQVLADLQDKIGVSPLQVREAALKGGIDGVGKLLGLDPAYVADVKKLTEYASTQDFGYNVIEHWHLGNQLLRDQNASLEKKLATGIEARITYKINEYRGRQRHFYDVPKPIKEEQIRIADALNLVEPIQRALMYKLGYEICYTPEVNADGIAFYPGIYGLHRKAANDLRDVKATYRIYFSGRGDLKGSMRTLVHEVAHNLWPEQFSPEEVKKIDAYAASDAAHFERWQGVVGEPEHYLKFERYFNAYKAADSDEKRKAVMASANEWLAHHNVTVDGLFPYLREAQDFKFLVRHAHDTLRQEGARYTNSGYDSAEERMREIISRFAELKQVELRGEPQLLHFLAPGLDQIWEAHYIPHLNRVYSQVVGAETATQNAITKAKAKPAKDDAAETPVPGAPVETPKVEERPVQPVASAPKAVSACLSDDVPRPQINAASAEVYSALKSLSAMGICPTR